jgi:hypothetical protein
VFRPHFSNLGKVKDINIGGLALEYVLNETKITGFSEIDIFLTDDFFYLRRIPSKTIYDREIDEESRSVKTRRCGLQFGDLTPTRKSQLEYFLQNYTSG